MTKTTYSNNVNLFAFTDGTFLLEFTADIGSGENMNRDIVSRVYMTQAQASVVGNKILELLEAHKNNGILRQSETPHLPN